MIFTLTSSIFIFLDRLFSVFHRHFILLSAALLAVAVAVALYFPMHSQKAAFSASDYLWGQDVDFSAAGDERYLKSGWAAAAESDSRWALGQRAEVEFRVPRRTTDVVLEAEVAPLVGGSLKVQTIKVSVNGTPLTSLRVARRQRLKVRVPYALFSGRDLMTIGFEFPEAVSPKSLGLGTDDRTLGFRFYSLVLS